MASVFKEEPTQWQEVMGGGDGGGDGGGEDEARCVAVTRRSDYLGGVM